MECLRQAREARVRLGSRAVSEWSLHKSQRLLVKTGGVKPRSTPSAWRLSLPEREEISRGLLANDSCRVIARRLGRTPSTVLRDVTRDKACPLAQAGATILVAGTAVFGAQDPAKAVKDLRSASEVSK